MSRHDCVFWRLLPRSAGGFGIIGCARTGFHAETLADPALAALRDWVVLAPYPEELPPPTDRRACAPGRPAAGRGGTAGSTLGRYSRRSCSALRPSVAGKIVWPDTPGAGGAVPLAEAAAAHVRLEGSTHIGRILLKIT